MTQKDTDRIKELASQHRIDPRPQAWSRLSEGLGHRKTKMQLSYYQKLSIAAALVAVLSVGALFTHYQSAHHQPGLFASNEEYRPIVLEELQDVNTSSMYTVAAVNDLSKGISRYLGSSSKSYTPASAIRVR